MLKSTREFTLLPEHITMLQNANVRWNDAEYGAPEIDPKRPFGNSWVRGDIEDMFPDGNIDMLVDAYYDLDKALEIVLSTLSFVPGTYAADDYRNNWRLVKTED